MRPACPGRRHPRLRRPGRRTRLGCAAANSSDKIPHAPGRKSGGIHTALRSGHGRNIRIRHRRNQRPSCAGDADRAGQGQRDGPRLLGGDAGVVRGVGRRPRGAGHRADRVGQKLQLRPGPARDGRLVRPDDGRGCAGPPACGVPRRAEAHAERDQRRRRLPDPHHRVGARLVHRRGCRPDLGGGHPLCQRRRQVFGARGQAGHRRRRRQPCRACR